jgi:hypothetical protein
MAMLRLGRRTVAILSATGACIFFLALSAQAQLSGRHVDAAGFSTVDEAALGDTLLSSIGLFGRSSQLTVGGGVGIAGGALRGYLGSNVEAIGSRWSIGAGFARSIATRELAGPLRGVLGGEVLAAAVHSVYPPHEIASVGLTAPLGVSLGDPSGPSLGLYATPYAEAGAGRQWRSTGCAPGGATCYTLSDVGLTHALGVGTELRLSFGRLSASALLSDVVNRRGPSRHSFPDNLAIGVTYRLGR